MLLAIDAGNTNTKFGFWNGESFSALETVPTAGITEESVCALLSKSEMKPTSAICASVVPSVEVALKVCVQRVFRISLHFLTGVSDTGLEVRIQQPATVGADRIANVLGALRKFKPPLIVVDIGTAATFDAVAADGAYLGGVIMPGVGLLGPALSNATAKLPEVDLEAPEQAIGRNTVEALQSGIMLGFAGGADSIIERIEDELGGGDIPVIATGGFAKLFMGVCKRLTHHDELLTLEGLVEAASRMEISVR